MSEDQRRSRSQERITELGGALIRAVCGERALHFRGLRLFRARTPLPWFAPHLHPSAPVADPAAFRGVADGLALRLTRSDAALHRQLRPEPPVERMLFELLEQFRAESLPPASLPGMRRNLRRRHEAWSLEYHHGGQTETARGLLLYTVAQICRARVFGEQVVEETEDLLEATRAALSPIIGTALAGLRADRHDQAAYAAHARVIAREVAAMLLASDRADDEAPSDSEREDGRSVFGLVADMERDVAEHHAAVAVADADRSRDLDALRGAYRVFTTDYDVEAAATSLVRPALLKALRERLDSRIAALGINIHRLARELQALLADPVRDGWDDAREEGRIDGRRLAQLVASPTERRLFRIERHQPAADCVLTMLIDCSGSMRAHAPAVATMADVMARALEQAGVASEVLGFTTASWSGGRAHRDWLRAGRPAHPGRLNERCHLVFKDAATSWRRARPAIAALMKDDLFREGLDGEAVDWACDRLLATDARRRILLVFSDGAPMDSATRLANDESYLDRHLQDVVERRELDGRVEIAGVGVGLDLSPYYRRSHVLDFSMLTGHAVFRELLALLAGRHRR